MELDAKKGLHPRNKHPGRYDFKKLVETLPELAPFIGKNPHNQEPSIDFANPDAVKTLNRALLKSFYGLTHWDMPPQYLCPPIPGRADYIHHVADLLGEGGEIPRGTPTRVLDIGVGASCIYPLIGNREYGWSFVGTDCDPVALKSAQTILNANPAVKDTVELRLQSSANSIFKGVLADDETFSLSICNPPFHASLADAKAGTDRKWKNLGKAPKVTLNFGGKESELWCPGGEVAFVRRMIDESSKIPHQILWFTTLISKESNLPAVMAALERVPITDGRVLDMSQGQKKSRVVAWTFLSSDERKKWHL